MRKTIAIRPVEFYGNALPRPRFFANPQFNSHRVDPPLLSWARDAHWSTGGLNFTRLRLQGRIEGDVDKLRAQLEDSSPGDSEKKKKRSSCDSPPPAAPVAVKRRRYVDLNDDEDGIRSGDEGTARIIRNLSGDFDRVAGESEICKKSIGSESVGKRLKEKKKTSSIRTSPRLTRIIPLGFRF
ncbi:hypothetical protein IGI04_013340 [Brassica rapa subsp. trilocularis]|uniref:Uncharacterized protein n=1 Tax=Brassica rapa subsp. trilocularis TaxID=1813537 RepID=A0ABQ7N8I7_BRACM|nr:hypothetical protein IGI04_013340 [Brassica rapa subsp. trilocularis]